MFDFYAFGPYRENVPRPVDVLGYPIGTWHTTYGTMEAYIDTLATAAPERVRHFTYGTSVEGQTQHLLAIGSSEHIAELDAIRADLQRLADPRATSQAEAEQIAQLNMAHNPESLTRHTAQYNAFGMGDADPQALEHDAPWGLSTNNNHY